MLLSFGIISIVVYNMIMYFNRLFIIYLVVLTFFTPSISYAVVPPDFIINISSQFAQFFSIVGILTATVFGSIFHFFKDVLSKTVKWVIAISTILIIFIVIYFKFFYLYSFYNDSLTLLYKNDIGQDQALVVELFRIETLPHIYKQYYIATEINDQKNKKSSYTKFYSRKSTVIEKDFVKKFSNKNNYNILTEDYLIVFELDNKEYTVDILNMHGDFIVNNSLERLTYTNMGTTDLSIDGEKYPTNYLLIKNLSTDVSKSVADNTLKSITNHEFIVDEDGGSYLVDNTIVTNPTDDYISHLWVLCKKGKLLEKKVNGSNIEYNTNNKIVSITNFCFDQSVKINEEEKSKFDTSETYLISGEIFDAKNNSKKIKGLNLYLEN